MNTTPPVSSTDQSAAPGPTLLRRTGTLLVVPLIAAAIGLTMLLNGVLPGIGLILFYAGAPISGLFGVIGGGIALSWPLDLTLWITLSFLVARATVEGRWRFSRAAMVMLGVALAYGLVMSLFVTVEPGWIETWESRQ